ncbi:MAG: 5-(carboxyamino)imidazole ribonucleotide mutase [Deltaproteobacteria bacterium]|jgi:phosphoribosylaminoimidazole carboxylase PurE protein|nr:5-(carboxyamino)imidazole ribonucleotide mutase [Deltaproteobacteria bacterium]
MKEKTRPIVSVVMGSDSDFPIMSETIKVLEDFGIPHEVFLTSAHRSPERTTSFAKGAAKKGIKVVIVGAGAAAHLAGVIASQSLLPVIGIPIDATALGGIDALLSIAQMPGGVPVATMAVGRAGAKNAALLAIRILAVEDKSLQKKLQAFIQKMAQDIEKKQENLTSCRKS